MLKKLLVVASLLIAGCVFVLGQTGTPSLRFEVASIKPSDPNSTGASMKLSPSGIVSISGMTIKNLISLAWRFPSERVSGGPKWLDSEKYEIEAKSPAGDSTASGQARMDETYRRIQTLLADRCQIRVHRETKETSVYVLTIAKTGLKMQEEKSTDPPSNDRGSVLPWSMIPTDLSRRLDRPVIDKTGLKGTWYVKLRYTTDDGQPAGMGVRIDPTQNGFDAGPSIFTALQEQLGLKLDSAKGPVDLLVIDSVTRPSAN